MGVRNASVSTKAIINAGVGNSAEVIVFTTPPINLPVDNAQVMILWQVTTTLGAAQTTYAVNIRRGTTTAGTLVNSGQSLTTVAATNVNMSGVIQDVPGIVAEQQYTLSVTANGAAAAGTVVDGSLQVIVL